MKLKGQSPTCLNHEYVSWLQKLYLILIKLRLLILEIGCEAIEPPRDGVVAVYNKIAQPKCRVGTYPDKLMSNLYFCPMGKWVAAGQGVYPFPDCLRKTSSYIVSVSK